MAKWIERVFKGWTAGDYFGLVGGISGIAGVIVAVFSLIETREQARRADEANAIAQEAIARSSGRIGSKIKTLGFTNIDSLPKDLIAFLGKGGDVRATRFRTVDDLLDIGPKAYIRNEGTDPIDAIRLEIHIDTEMLDQIGFRFDESVIRGRARVRESDIQDFQLTEKLMPKGELGIPMGKCLLGQMMQVEGKAGQVSYAIFRIGLSSRLVGGTAFDPILVEDKGVRRGLIAYAWVPSGFPEEKCRKLYSELHLRVEHPPPFLEK